MKLFLSRDRAGKELTEFARARGWELDCFSCIEFSLTDAIEPPAADWIFFYSPSAVKLFADNYTSRSYRFATLGEGTADAMRDSELQLGFIGKSSDTSEVMEEFRAVIKSNEKVVQARGEKSFERLREQLPTSQILDWPFYRTQAKREIPETAADFYIFTSPSNAEAYMDKFELPENAVVVVFGESTKAAVREKSEAQILVTDEPGEEGVIKSLQAFPV